MIKRFMYLLSMCLLFMYLLSMYLYKWYINLFSHKIFLLSTTSSPNDRVKRLSFSSSFLQTNERSEPSFSSPSFRSYGMTLVSDAALYDHRRERKEMLCSYMQFACLKPEAITESKHPQVRAAPVNCFLDS